MPRSAWEQLLAGWPWFGGAGRFPIQPNSEFMPPVRLVRKPYGTWDPPPYTPDDPWGWPVTEYEEALVLRPGLRSIAHQILNKLAQLVGRGEGPGIAEFKLRNNPYWPPELAAAAEGLRHEHLVLLLPLALSITQDDKARLRWTLFGGSEQGPARAFWRGFFSAPGREVPKDDALAFFRQLLHRAYGEPHSALEDLRVAGFRILPEGEPLYPHWRENPLPRWTARYLWSPSETLEGTRFLLTFRPFRKLPPAVQRAYVAGKLHLLPFPGSLVFWGASGFAQLLDQLPFALQIPLLQGVERQSGVRAMRVPQSGWLEEPGERPPPPHHGHGPMLSTYKRTHRHDRIRRSEDELVSAQEDKVAHVLFSAAPSDIGLYDKPMARNVQLWTDDFRLLLDGPHAAPADLQHAAHVLRHGGLFGYRFVFPAMRVGQHELYWQRPLAAICDRDTGRAVLLDDAPLGYLTAYPAHKPDLARPVELWPRLLQREPHLANIELFKDLSEERPLQTLFNVRKILQAWEAGGKKPLSLSFARQLLKIDKRKTLATWLSRLPGKAKDRERARWLATELAQCVASEDVDTARPLPAALTYDRTARRSFEVGYWNAIAFLSTGGYCNKNNADCVLDPPTQAALHHHHRDLEPLGDYLLEYHTEQIASLGLTGKALAGELPFQWRTDFAYPWMGGWKHNQDGTTHERNLLVIIPGRDRRRAVLMADHYDTAYMADWYEKEQGGTGARLAAPGADDNCSATATLMLACPIFLELSRQGRLACDIWLVHLTGEEYPAEGLGACHLCQSLVEGTLKVCLRDGKERDLSGVRVQGLYVLDMVAHNRENDRDVFQVAPGVSRESLWLAQQAHMANEIWNASVPAWNRSRARRGAGRGHRRRSGTKVPDLALHPRLQGEIRPSYDPRSTLYNTDGQAFSDVGVPVVLFMENYDIDRAGYHDTKDTLAKIDLDYGAALAAITIETVARAATAKPPRF
jgi:hypothetical protein